MLIWSEHLETGEVRTDREHREIYDQLNEIGAAIEREMAPEAVTRLIVVLLDYAYLHFHHEENAMACARCPLHDRNCQAHRVFIERLQHWLAVIADGNAPRSLIQDIYGETCRWIKAHIENVDTALRATPGAGPGLEAAKADG